MARGFVASLARPGGNVTGIFLDQAEIGGKQLQFLRETMTGLVRVAVLWEPEVGEAQLLATEAAARMIGITLNAHGARRAEEIKPALQRAARERAQALVVLTSPLFANNRRQIGEMTEKYRLPAISSFTSLAEAGTLMAYGPSLPEMYRRAASYVDRILRGVKARDLPVERPSRFELVINSRPPRRSASRSRRRCCARADQVIE